MWQWKMLNQKAGRRAEQQVKQSLNHLSFPTKRGEGGKTVAPTFDYLLDGYIARHFSCKQCESTGHCKDIC